MAGYYPTYLYRVYDVYDRLLYVGVSDNLVERLRRHSHNPPYGKDWWHEVTYCSIESFPKMWQALEAEVTAIRSEAPLYNVRSAVNA